MFKDDDKHETCYCENCLRLQQALDEVEDIANDYNRVEKTSQYYRDGFDEIQNIINKAKAVSNAR
jgi:hypothetical protein